MRRRTDSGGRTGASRLALIARQIADALEGLRQLIKQTVPHVQERVSYGTTVMLLLGGIAWIRIAAKAPIVLHGESEAGARNERPDHFRKCYFHDPLNDLGKQIVPADTAWIEARLEGGAKPGADD